MRTSICVPWSEVQDLPESYRLLSLFRSTNPLLGHLQPDDLHWEVAWSGGFTPVDMGAPPGTRATARSAAVSDVILSCANTPDSVGHTVLLDHTPAVIRMHILAEELGRTG